MFYGVLSFLKLNIQHVFGCITDIYPPMLSFKGVLAWVTVNFLTGETWGRHLGKDI